MIEPTPSISIVISSPGRSQTGGVLNEENRKKGGVAPGDPSIGTGEYGNLWDEAGNAGALGADKSIDLSSCASWSSQINCVSLRRVEQRFGDGDGVYTLAEQEHALNTYYNSFFGPWRFYAPARSIRVGLELKF